MKVVVSRKAYGDLQRIFLFQAESSLAHAERVTAEFNRQFTNLSRFPKLGRPWPEIESGMRRLVVGQYLIFYKVSETALGVVRIIDGRMDVRAELLR